MSSLVSIVSTVPANQGGEQNDLRLAMPRDVATKVK
jgi:hypothetical protein